MKKKKNIRQNTSLGLPACHIRPVEVIENLYCGSADEALAMVAAPINVDILVALHDLNAVIWRLGFRGEILYYPIEDFETLPSDVLEELVSTIIERLACGKKVGIFYMVGQGRTVYVASVVLGRLGQEDPIKFLREHYCEFAVESNNQIRHIADFLAKPELVDRYLVNTKSMGYQDYYYGNSVFLPDLPQTPLDGRVCGKCAHFDKTDGICKILLFTALECELACNLYQEIET